MSLQARPISMVAKVEANDRPVRPVWWFRTATISLVVCILGIVTLVVGGIMLLLKYIRIQRHYDDKTHFYYFGAKVPKPLGWYLVAAGVVTLLFASIVYHAALVRIDDYIATIQALVEGPTKDRQPLLAKNDKTKRQMLTD